MWYTLKRLCCHEREYVDATRARQDGDEGVFVCVCVRLRLVFLRHVVYTEALVRVYVHSIPRVGTENYYVLRSTATLS